MTISGHKNDGTVLTVPIAAILAMIAFGAIL